MSTTGRRSSNPAISPPCSQRSIMNAARRPSPTARVMSVGPVTTSPAAKMWGTSVWSVSRSATSVPLPFGHDAGRERARVGSHADGHDDGLALDHEVAAGHRLRPSPSGRVGRTERHPRVAQPAHVATLVAEHFERGHQVVEADAFVLARPRPRRGAPASPRGRAGRRRVTERAPSRRAVRAASMATLPPPTTTTRLPVRSAGSPRRTARRNSTPPLTPARSSPGTSRRVERGVPVASRMAS